MTSIMYDIFDSKLGKVIIATYNDILCNVAIGNNAASLVDLFLWSKYQNKTEFELNTINPDLVEKVLNVIDNNSVEVINYNAIGTTFQKRVWSEISKIPTGETISYKELAKRIGNPKAVRAVGSACKANPIAIIIPCHRVILSNGCVGQYAFGINRKIELLTREGVKVNNI